MKTLLVVSSSFDPYKNHSVEKLLFTENFSYDEILYLWVNRPTVVFGRNQNPWKEVYISKARELGIDLIRRSSGGGTVYHDSGNLNFSFIAKKKNYDESRNFSIVKEALELHDLPTLVNSRKDLIYQDKKISGNAFCLKQEKRLHHGTLLVDVDMSSLWKVLKFDASRIDSKSISSQRSEVMNLSEIRKDITVEKLMNSIKTVYSDKNNYLEVKSVEKIINQYPNLFKQYYYEQNSWEWIFGETPKFRYILDEFGYVDIRNGKVVDGSEFSRLEEILNQPFDEEALLKILLREV